MRGSSGLLKTDQPETGAESARMPVMVERVRLELGLKQMIPQKISKTGMRQCSSNDLTFLFISSP